MALVHRAIDQFWQVIDVFVSPRRDAAAARRFFQRAGHRTDRYVSHIETDHGRLKSRLHPMRGPKAGPQRQGCDRRHGFVQNLRRGHYERAVEEPVARRLAGAFDELALAI